MANFDLSKYQEVPAPKTKKFDLSKYQEVSAPTAGRQLEQGMHQIMGSLEDVGGGAREGIQNLGAYLTQKLPQDYQIPRYEAQPHTSMGRLPIEAGKILSSFVPGMGAERVVTGVLGAAEQIPGWISRILGGAAGGAAAAPGLDVSPAEGAALGGAGAAIPEALMGALGKFLGRNVTPEQFESARQAVPPGIKAPIGELADSPRAKKLYGGARGIALSQADKPYSQLYDHLNKGAKELVADAPGVSNPSQFVYDDIKSSYEALKNRTDEAYDKLGVYAEANNVPFNSAKFQSQIEDGLSDIKKLAINKTTMKVYKDAIDVLKDYKTTKVPTFEDALNARHGLNDVIESSIGGLPASGANKKTLRILQKMKSGLDDSIKESSQANPELFNLHKAANDLRIEQGTFENLNRKDVSPFYKIYSKDGTPDNLIGAHIRTGNKGDDYSGLMSKLTSKLSPQARDVMAKAHLNPRDETSLAKQITKINKLSPGQRDALFGDKAPLAHHLSKLSKTFPGATGAGFTPMTGFTGGKNLQILGEGAGIGAAAHGGSPSLLAAALGLPAYGQVTQRILRSDALKDAYAGYLKTAKGKPLTKPKYAERLARTLALAATGGNDGS